MIHALHQLQNIFMEASIQIKENAPVDAVKFSGYVLFSYLVNRHKSALRRFCGLDAKRLGPAQYTQQPKKPNLRALTNEIIENENIRGECRSAKDDANA